MFYFNRIIRFIKQQLIYGSENEKHATKSQTSLDINLNAILIDSEASSRLFVFSMSLYSL